MTLPDPHNLQRFVDAQENTYERALAEVQAGRKQSHWMWYILPQLRGLGRSAIAERYGIADLDEAAAYLAHPLLGQRLTEICSALLAAQGRTAHEIFGSPDDLKLHSCATLFTQVAPPASVFEQILARYYAGEADAGTLQHLLAAKGRPQEHR